MYSTTRAKIKSKAALKIEAQNDDYSNPRLGSVRLPGRLLGAELSLQARGILFQNNLK